MFRFPGPSVLLEKTRGLTISKNNHHKTRLHSCQATLGKLRPREVTHLQITQRKNLLAPESHVPISAEFKRMAKFKILVPHVREQRENSKNNGIFNVPVPCTNAEVPQKCIPQNTNVAKYSMKKDSVVKAVWETLHSEPTPVKPKATGWLVFSGGSQERSPCDLLKPALVKCL